MEYAVLSTVAMVILLAAVVMVILLAAAAMVILLAAVAMVILEVGVSIVTLVVGASTLLAAGTVPTVAEYQWLQRKRLEFVLLFNLLERQVKRIEE